MPLAFDDAGTADPDALAAIARRLTLAGAPMTPSPTGGLAYTPPPSDPFRFLAPVGNAIGAVGNAVGGAFQAAQDAPVLGGALRGLSAVGDAAINTPIGLAALGADQFLHTGLTQAAQQQNAGRPWWELPKTAAGTISQGLSGVANDPNADPFSRLVAGTAGAVKDVGSLVAPLPGIGEAAALARRVGGVGRAADAAAAVGREGNVVRPVFGDVARAAQNSDAVRTSGRFQFTAPDAAPAEVAPTAPNIATDGGFHQQIADSQAQQHANPTPVGDLANRAPISVQDPGAGTFTKPATPHFTTDATLTADLQASLRARGIEPPAPTSTTRAPSVQTNIDQLRQNALKQRIGGPAPTGGTAPASVLGDRMLPNESGIVGASARGESWVTPELMAKHYANEALTNAAKSGDVAAARDALATLEQHGASASNTAKHLRDAGVALPRGATFAHIREALMPKPIADMPPIAPKAPRAAPALPEQLNAETLSQRIGAPNTVAQQATNDVLRRAVAERTGTSPTFDTIPGSAPARAEHNFDPFAVENETRTAAAAQADRMNQAGVDPNTDWMNAPARADGTGTETVGQAKQALADRLGVNPTTGRPLKGPLSAAGTKIPESWVTPSSGWDKFLSVWNLPKALKASFDLSAPLRQGILLAPGHPGDFFGALKPMLQAAKDSKFAAALDTQIKSVDRPGLYLAPIDGALGAREEQFMSNLADKIPGMSASNRAYTTFLNKLRADVYDHTIDGWTAGGKTISEADRTGLANIINHFSGRGDLPNAVKDLTPALNGLFFSPRFTVSRFQSVGDALGVLKNRDSLAAKQAASDMTKFVGAGLGVLALAKLAGAAVESDPRSSAFGKMRFGDTSVELWGGMQPIARYTAQLITGQSKPVAGAHADQVINAARIDTLTRFGTSKLSPSAGTALGVLRGPTAKAPSGSIGRNFIGQNFSATDLLDPTPGANNSLVTPLGWSDIADAIAADRARGGSGIGGALSGASSLLGAGVQTITRSGKGGTYSGPPSAPRANFQFSAPSQKTGPTTGGGTFKFQSAPSRTSVGGTGGHMPAPVSGDMPSVIQSTAQQAGIDPNLALAVAQQESGFNQNAVGDNGNSHGLFQENVNGRGAGRAPDLDPVGQTQRFAADVRQFTAQHHGATPGQIAAAVQRPANPAQYAASVDAIYRRLAGR